MVCIAASELQRVWTRLQAHTEQTDSSVGGRALHADGVGNVPIHCKALLMVSTGQHHESPASTAWQPGSGAQINFQRFKIAQQAQEPLKTAADCTVHALPQSCIQSRQYTMQSCKESLKSLAQLLNCFLNHGQGQSLIAQNKATQTCCRTACSSVANLAQTRSSACMTVKRPCSMLPLGRAKLNMSEVIAPVV